jgi:hypothetical protein
MASYDTILGYINCSQGVKDEITRIDAVITALQDAQLKGALNGEVSEYSLDDGQTKIKQVFNSYEGLSKAVLALETRKKSLINENCLGRVMTLRDKDSFNLYKGHGY